ncbi:hypothetical protein D3C87_1355970 [compost metagenome]
MLAEHLFQTLGWHRSEAAASEFSEAVEVEQLALREQHHERADGVIEQYGLDLARRVQAVMIQDLFVGDAQFAQQQPNNRRSVRGGGCEGNFGHGSVSVLKQLQEYNQLAQADGPETATVLTLGRIAARGAASGRVMG